MKYSFLKQETAPRHLLKAIELLGIKETVGSIHNPVIMGWAKEVGLEKVYISDEIPWCGLFVAVVMKRADREVIQSPLWALSWRNFGVTSPVPMLGDILCFKRNGGGHVGFYVGEDKDCYHVLGGNQGNSVSITRIAKSRMVEARRPVYNSIPSNVRKIVLDSTGPVSQNEA